MLRTLILFAGVLTPLLLTAETLNITLEDMQQWRPIGADGQVVSPARASELVVGKPDFIKVKDLPAQDANKLLSTRVGIFWDPEREGICTGSLVGPDLFLTNHHCVTDGRGGVVSPDPIIIWLDFSSPDSRSNEQNSSHVSQILSYDQTMDYALLKLKTPLGNRLGWLTLEDNHHQIQQIRSVKIIQHPDGRSKEIVTTNTDVADCGSVPKGAISLCYIADTQGGSSGSPVFGLDGEKIIALHNGGFQGLFNTGTKSHLILEKITQFLPVTGASAAPQPTPAQKKAPPASEPAPVPQENHQDWKPII